MPLQKSQAKIETPGAKSLTFLLDRGTSLNFIPFDEVLFFRVPDYDVLETSDGLSVLGFGRRAEHSEKREFACVSYEDNVLTTQDAHAKVPF